MKCFSKFYGAFSLSFFGFFFALAACMRVFLPLIQAMNTIFNDLSSFRFKKCDNDRECCVWRRYNKLRCGAYLLWIVLSSSLVLTKRFKNNNNGKEENSLHIFHFRWVNTGQYLMGSRGRARITIHTKKETKLNEPYKFLRYMISHGRDSNTYSGILYANVRSERQRKK